MIKFHYISKRRKTIKKKNCQMILKFQVKRDQMRVTEEHGQKGSNGVVVLGKRGK